MTPGAGAWPRPGRNRAHVERRAGLRSERQSERVRAVGLVDEVPDPLDAQAAVLAGAARVADAVLGAGATAHGLTQVAFANTRTDADVQGDLAVVRLSSVRVP